MELKKRKMWMNGGNLVIAIPRELARHFKLVAGNEIDTYYYDNKLIVDLTSAGEPRLFDVLPKAPEKEVA